ncbi:MAG: phage major capsid protein [Dongiaceae bacterium]
MSDRLNALRQKLGATTDRMDEILAVASAAGRELTAEESQLFGDLEADIKKIDEAIAMEERVVALKARMAKPMAGVDAGGRPTAPAMPKRRTYGREMKAFGARSFGSIENAEEAAYRSGMWCRAVVYDDKAAQQWCAEHDVPLTRAQSEDVNTEGGYLVFDEMSTAIVDLREKFGTFRRFADVRQMASDTQLVPKRLTGTTAHFATEGSAFTESEKTWGNIRLQAQSLGALTKISRELAEDAVISVADDIASEMAYSLAVKEDEVGWNGTGISTDGGITGVRTKIIDGTHAASAIAAASGHDTFAEIDATDLNLVISAVPQYADPTAKWYGSQRAWALMFLRLATAAAGNSVETFLDGKPGRAYLGYPFMTDQTLPATTGDLSDVAMAFFGDLAKAVILGERRGITIDVTRERYWELRQIGIMGWERIDINVHSLGDNTTPGPLIALIGE